MKFISIELLKIQRRSGFAWTGFHACQGFPYRMHKRSEV